MLDRLGKKIFAGVGAFLTVFGSNALSNAMQTKEKAIQNAAETVNRNSGGYSRNGALLSPRTLGELLLFGIGILGHNYKMKKDRIFLNNQCYDQFHKLLSENENLNENKNELNENKNELNEKINKLEQQVYKLKNDAKVKMDVKEFETFFEFLRNYVHPVREVIGDSHFWLDNWRDLDEEKWNFVPRRVAGWYYSIIGDLNLKRMYGAYDSNWKLSSHYYKIKKDIWDLGLTEEEIEEISKSTIPLGALDHASVRRNYGTEEILSSGFGLREYNGGVVKWGENCKKVFSKVQKFNSEKGWVLCEGFVTKSGKNEEGLVVRLTYGDVVGKNK